MVECELVSVNQWISSILFRQMIENFINFKNGDFPRDFFKFKAYYNKNKSRRAMSKFSY